MQILKEMGINNWEPSLSNELKSQAVEELEEGKILLFPNLPFKLLPHELQFLTDSFADPKYKNISYNSVTKRLNGAKLPKDADFHLKEMMQRFAESASALVGNLLIPYNQDLQMGRTSYRPVEIFGRQAKSYRKDDTRLHVDAFPSSPNQGKRILRVFTNINPHGQDRHWKVGEPFAEIAKRFLPAIPPSWFGRAIILKALGITRTYSTEYDYIMLQLHNRMKADLQYQKVSPQSDLRFSPGSSWIVQTDHVSHAALSGQYVLEQTFYLPVSAMVNPACSPLKTLERLLGKALV